MIWLIPCIISALLVLGAIVELLKLSGDMNNFNARLDLVEQWQRKYDESEYYEMQMWAHDQLYGHEGSWDGFDQDHEHYFEPGIEEERECEFISPAK